MPKGSTKHEAAIISDIQSLLTTQFGVMTHDQLTKIISNYYSETYSKQQGQKAIIRELSRRNIAVLINVKIPNAPSLRTHKHSPRNPLLSLLLDSNIPPDRKQTVIAAFLRTFLPAFTPPMKRTVSKDVILEDFKSPQKRTETIEFPSIHFRSMLLHRFLLNSFPNCSFSIADISQLIPVHLKMQIMRGIDSDQKEPHLSLIRSLRPADFFELDVLIPSLRPPYHPLLTRDNILNPIAIVELPFLGIVKRFHFFSDPTAHSTYWILFFSVISQRLIPFPQPLSVRFEPFISKVLNTIPIHKLPFFPREVENLAEILGVAIPVISFALHKVFKRKLRAMTCSREAFIDSKIFPSTGLATFLATGSSAIPVVPPIRCLPLSQELLIEDNSVRSFARLAAVSRLTNQGYIVAKDQPFTQLRNHANRWLFDNNKKIRTVVSSFSKNPIFQSLFFNELAKLIQTMRTPTQIINPIEKIEVPAEYSAEFASESERFLQPLCSEIPPIIPTQIPEKIPDFERHFPPDLSTDSEVVLSFKPVELVFDFENTLEVVQSEFLDHFKMVKRVRDIPISVSIAAEFLKIILRESDQLAHLKTRQLAHLLPSDLSSAIFILDGCDLYHSHFKRSVWNFPGLAEEPHSQSISICEGNDPTVSIVWKHTEIAPIISLSWLPQEPEIDDKFSYFRIRSLFPALQNVIEQTLNGPILYDFDPLIQFAFGQWETEIGEIESFEQRYILNLLNAAGVNGLTCLEILDAFGISGERCEESGNKVMNVIYKLLEMEMIARVPTGKIEPRFSRFMAPNMLIREVDEKMMLVNLHVWIRADGSVDSGIRADLRKKIAVFVFGHEFCDFGEVLEEFHWIAALDLVIILEALEDDEIIVSYLIEKEEGSLSENDATIPRARFEFPELFLSAIAYRKTLHWIFRTTPEMFANLGPSNCRRTPQNFQL
jgi:hypothetical protein